MNLSDHLIVSIRVQWKDVKSYIEKSKNVVFKYCLQFIVNGNVNGKSATKCKQWILCL